MSILIFYFLFNVLSHYSGNTTDNLNINGVKTERTYNYFYDENSDGHIDSTLSAERTFNIAGHTLTTILYDDSERVKLIYENEYLGDTVRISKKTYACQKDSFIAITNLNYNEKGQEVLNESFDAKGDKMPIHEAKKYDKNGKVSFMSVFSGKDLMLKEKYKYDGSGRLENISTIKKIGSRKDIKEYYQIVYDSKGRESHIYELKKPKTKSQKRLVRMYEYDDNNRIITSTSHCYFGMNIIGVQGTQRVNKGDQLKRTITYYDNGLVKSETEYLNGILNGTRKYFYEYE